MRAPEEVEEFFERELLPEVRQQRERLEAAKLERQRVALPISHKLGIVAAGLLLDFVLGGLGATWVALAAAALVDLWRARGLPPLPRFDVKRELIGRSVRFLDPHLEYDPTGRVPDHVLRDSGLWSAPFDSISGEDRICGKLGSTLLDLSEIRIEKRYGDKSKRLFTGLLFVADFNKEFQSRTWVLSDASERHLGMLGRALQQTSLGGGRGELVQLEDPAFERFFRVHSEDPTEARYLLSPGLMRRIREFRENLNATLSLSFVGGRIYVLLEHPHDLFAAVGVEHVDAAVLRRWLGEVLFATSLVEEFDLNTRIWSKASADVGFRGEALADGVLAEAAAPGAGRVEVGAPAGPAAMQGPIAAATAVFTRAGAPAAKQSPVARPAAPRRPLAPSAAHAKAAPLARLLEAALAGHLPLWKVWLVCGMGCGVAIGQLTSLLVQTGALPASVASVVGLVAALPPQFLIWRNSGNCEWLGWTLLARGGALLSLVILAAALASLAGFGPVFAGPTPG